MEYYTASPIEEEQFNHIIDRIVKRDTKTTSIYQKIATTNYYDNNKKKDYILKDMNQISKVKIHLNINCRKPNIIKAIQINNNRNWFKLYIYIYIKTKLKFLFHNT